MAKFATALAFLTAHRTEIAQQAATFLNNAATGKDRGSAILQGVMLAMQGAYKTEIAQLLLLDRIIDILEDDANWNGNETQAAKYATARDTALSSLSHAIPVLFPVIFQQIAILDYLVGRDVEATNA